MKVALYSRVSTEQQIDNYSIPLQRERLEAFCTSKGWTHTQEYIDAGYSGSNLNRPALQQLQKDIKNKKINMVIVYRLDRLSRSQRDTLHLIEEVFLPHEVEFISLSETIDTTTAFGRAAIGVLSVFAQLERETILERLRSCHHKMVREEGLWSGGSATAPYGYTRLARGELVVNEEERKHIVRIFEDYIKLKSYTKVQDQLEKEGFARIKVKRLVHLLQNRVYIGEVSFAGEWYKGAHEPIISEDLFNQVQQTFKENRGSNFGKVKNKVFTGKVFCARCGEEYRSYSHTDKLATGEKATYHYLICDRRKKPSHYESKCFNRTIRRDEFEKEIFTRIKNLETIIKSTRADIVVTSSWKYLMSYEELLKMWNARNLPGFITDTTPNISNHRGDEIDAWIRECKTECEYVIIDDLDSRNFNEHHLPHLITVNPYNGLDEIAAKQAIEILG